MSLNRNIDDDIKSNQLLLKEQNNVLIDLKSQLSILESALNQASETYNGYTKTLDRIESGIALYDQSAKSLSIQMSQELLAQIKKDTDAANNRIAEYKVNHLAYTNALQNEITAAKETVKQCEQLVRSMEDTATVLQQPHAQIEAYRNAKARHREEGNLLDTKWLDQEDVKKKVNIIKEPYENSRDLVGKSLLTYQEGVNLWKEQVSIMLMIRQLNGKGADASPAAIHSAYQTLNNQLQLNHDVLKSTIIIKNSTVSIRSVIDAEIKKYEASLKNPEAGVAASKVIKDDAKSIAEKRQAELEKNQQAPDYDGYVKKMTELVNDKKFLQGEIIHINVGIVGDFFMPKARPPIIGRIATILDQYKNNGNETIAKKIQEKVQYSFKKTVEGVDTHNGRPKTKAFMEAALNFDSFDKYYNSEYQMQKTSAQKKGSTW